MPEWLSLQLEYFLRLVIAGFMGGIIGFERKNRLKEAGVRTHLIVALASCLMILISKYGFFDVIGLDGIGLDPSRVAAGIVSSVGFLGAGMIFIRKQSINGLTTAAGMWATVGVGMAIGAGMYAVGVFAAILIIIVQILLHKKLRWLHVPIAEPILVKIEDTSDALPSLQRSLRSRGVQIINFKAEKQGDGTIEVDLYAKLPDGCDVGELMNLLRENPQILSVEI